MTGDIYCLGGTENESNVCGVPVFFGACYSCDLRNRGVGRRKLGRPPEGIKHSTDFRLF